MKEQLHILFKLRKLDLSKYVISTRRINIFASFLLDVFLSQFGELTHGAIKLLVLFNHNINVKRSQIVNFTQYRSLAIK